MDKRGLSAVITTLLIILLVIVSIGIVWVVIRNIIAEGVEDISFEGFKLDLSIKSAYVDGSDIKVGVRRSPGGGDITGIKFIFNNGTDSIVIDRDVALAELDERTFSFSSITEVPGIGGGDDVSVAPIFESSGSEKIGDITDTEEIAGQPPAGVGNGNGNGGDCTPVCVDPLPHCVNSFCVECISDSDCSPEVCNPDGQCVECTDNSDCSPGNLCDSISNSCIPDTPKSTGTIFSVWPSTSKRFFDSQDLPTTDPDWVTEAHYVNFSSPEIRCILIFDFIVGSGSDEDYSYIRRGLDPDDPAPQISGGDGYQVWRTETCGPV